MALFHTNRYYLGICCLISVLLDFRLSNPFFINVWYSAIKHITDEFNGDCYVCNPIKIFVIENENFVKDIIFFNYFDSS